jgi:sulfate/thiosulfate transport system permease protein
MTMAQPLPLTARVLIFVVVGYLVILLVGPVVAVILQAVSQGVRPLWLALTQPTVLHAFGMTLWIAIATVGVCTVFGTLVAFVLVRQRFIGRSLLNGLVDLPFAVSPVVAGLMYILVFGRGGWLEPWAEAAGIKIIFNWPGMLLATIFVSMPFVIRELMPVLKSRGMDEEQAAYTLGANRWTTFWRVTLPGIKWGLFYGIVLTFARAVGEFGAVLVVSGGISGRTETATLFIFRALDERQEVAAAGAALVMASLSLMILMSMELIKRVPETGRRVLPKPLVVTTH